LVALGERGVPRVVMVASCIYGAEPPIIGEQASLS